MHLTLELMEAFVHCRYKTFLKCAGDVGTPTEYEVLERTLSGEYGPKAMQRLVERYSPREVAPGPLPLKDVLKCRHRLILNAFRDDEYLSVVIPAVERLPSGRQSEYGIVTFSPVNKLARPTKLLAAVLATATGKIGLPISYAKVIFGQQLTVTRLGLSGPNGITLLGNQATSMLADLENMATTPVAPRLCLNSHCAICEYHERCRKDATDRDDLSLLKGLQAKEIETWNQRGIFTVTQLAHTFRPKAMGRDSSKPKRHSQPLQAMAIRDKTTYVRKRPEMPAVTTKVYLDVEGIPDTGLYYLIGLLVVADGKEPMRQQLWADSESDQEPMWYDFLSALGRLDDYVVVHFGRYERDFIREMIQRFGMNGETSEEGLFSRLFDVHGAIRTNVFFPVYSNGLKEIASFVGVRWQGPVYSGLDSIVWRHKWEKARDASVKEALLSYNHLDCLAVMAVFDHLVQLAGDANGRAADCQEIDTLPSQRKGEFGSKGFALPAMKTITKCAYFKYQQNKVFFRTDKSVRRSIRRKRSVSRANTRANTIVVCAAPSHCPKCGSQRFTKYNSSRQAKIVRDLKFMRGGVKRWVVKVETHRYQCRDCLCTRFSPEYPTKQPKFGHGLESWAVYQHVALRQSFEGVTMSVNDLFGYSFSEPTIQRAVTLLANEHETTEGRLLAQLRRGNVMCGDEAKIKIRRGIAGYVWAFSGPEVVIYRFSKSRDGTVLNEVLKGFEGVLVSDFYNVYDSAPCPQQKCLIHLIRDINDDLLKAPFDEELKELATRFTALMTPVIECIDRYGLTKRHLNKYSVDAERYQKWVAGQLFTSKVAQGYQKRISKYGSRLFTFLLYDGVPWNNNLAENAVKLIASRRRLIDGLMSEEGIKNYLIFLSIYQTLRRKGGSFLRFFALEKD